MSYVWKYIEPTGPTLDITKKIETLACPFPYFEDERTNDEIQQERFDNWQQQYEFERDHPETVSND